jgi:hypothetical protein
MRKFGGPSFHRCGSGGLPNRDALNASKRAAVLRGVMPSSLFGVVRCVSEVPLRDVRMVPCLHMIAGFVMLRGFPVVPGCVLMVLGCLMMVRSACVICHGCGSPLLSGIGP